MKRKSKKTDSPSPSVNIPSGECVHGTECRQCGGTGFLVGCFEYEIPRLVHALAGGGGIRRRACSCAAGRALQQRYDSLDALRARADRAIMDDLGKDIILRPADLEKL